jgi:hypothetical protein
MKNCVRGDYVDMQLDYSINYYATWVQLQYGNTIN